MISEIWNNFILFETSARQTFIGTVILVSIPAVIIGLILLGIFGKPAPSPSNTCPCCGQKIQKGLFTKPLKPKSL